MKFFVTKLESQICFDLFKLILKSGKVLFFRSQVKCYWLMFFFGQTTVYNVIKKKKKTHKRKSTSPLIN